MREFPGNSRQPANDEVRALTAAAYECGEWLFTDLNGVLLAADPRPADPDYNEQLVWTYNIAADPENSAIIGPREVFQNLVPELQALGYIQLARLIQPSEPHDKTLVQVLLPLVPVTWCEWAWPERRMRQVTAQLAGSHNGHIIAAKAALSGAGGHLNAAWYRQASLWLMQA
jgi:hypothetical protein